MPRGALTALFEPRAIAVIGASRDPAKIGHQIMKRLIEGRFPGALHPINPGASEVLARQAHATLDAVRAPIDLAIVAVPAERCVDAIEDCARAHVAAALVVSSGFAETNDAGARLQTELARVAIERGVALLGPNTSGFLNPARRVMATFVEGGESIAPGGVALVAHSGGVNLSLAHAAQSEGLGVRLAVGLGNAAALDTAAVVDHLSEDSGTCVICLHLEGVLGGRALFEAVRRAVPKKPVIVFPVGRAAESLTPFARAHTGAALGDHALTKAALEQAGAVVVSSSERLIDAAAALSRVRARPRARAVAVLSAQAGPGLIIADELQAAGFDVPALSAETQATVAPLLGGLTCEENPIDTGRPSSSLPDVVRAVAADPGIDVVAAFVLHEPAAWNAEALFSAVGAKPGGKPIAFATGGPGVAVTGTRSALAALGVPAYPSPDRLASAVVALLKDAAGQAQALREQVPLWCKPARTEPVRLPAVAHSEDAAKKVLAQIGVATPRRVVCNTRADVRAALTELGAPVVVKVLDAAITNKAEVGGVIPGVDSLAAVDAAVARLDDVPGSPGPRRYLVEETSAPGVDLVVVGRSDRSFGAVISVARADRPHDVQVRLSPLSRDEALQMVDALAIAAAFDRAVVADAIVAVGRLMADNRRSIERIDLRPVRVYAQGLLALDAVFVPHPFDGVHDGCC